LYGTTRPKVVDTLLERVPGITIATDIICGFPGETEEDWEMTMALCRKYDFIELHLSQFYPRPGTPAARMKKVNSREVKRRSRELTNYIESYLPHGALVGTTQRVWVTDIAKDGISLVAHTKSYVQVLLPGGEAERVRLMGKSAVVKIIESARWYVRGEVLEVEERTSARPRPPPPPTTTTTTTTTTATKGTVVKARKGGMFAALDAELEKRKNAKDGGGSCATCGAAEGETCGESSSSSSSATATRTASASFTSLEYLLFGGIALGVLGVVFAAIWQWRLSTTTTG